jgi:hypothetical protein
MEQSRGCIYESAFKLKFAQVIDQINAIDYEVYHWGCKSMRTNTGLTSVGINGEVVTKASICDTESFYIESTSPSPKYLENSAYELPSVGCILARRKYKCDLGDGYVRYRHILIYKKDHAGAHRIFIGQLRVTTAKRYQMMMLVL